MPVIAGMLTAISGALGILGAFSYSIDLRDAGSGLGKGDMPPFVPGIIFGMPIPAIILIAISRDEFTR